MSKEILISIDPKVKRVAVTKDGRLDEFYVEALNSDVILGNIYIGKVKSVVPALGASFVDIGTEKNGFLYLSEIDSPILDEDILEPFVMHQQQAAETDKSKEVKSGQEIWVQVVKEPFGTKGPRLTTHISLPGRYLVLMPFDKQVGISRRIEDRSERERLRDILERSEFFGDNGFIVRTAALGKEKRDILRDAAQLVKLWKNIKRFSTRKTAPVLIYEDIDLISKVVRDYFSDDVKHLFVDSRLEFKRIRNYARSALPRTMMKCLHLYQGKEPLYESKKIDKEIEKIYQRKVYFKSGAYIVIEKTEGLIVVDVNSGRFKSKSDSEKNAYFVNLEAAKELARQLRLRDYSGIIVTDFIDMSQEHHKRHVLETLREALKSDHAKTEVLGMSKLGLVEMTRERTAKPVETIYFKDCPYCNGTGKIKND